MPRPTWTQVQEFCRRQDYIEVATDHWRYEKLVGEVLSWTKVSHGAGNETVPRQLWKLVWSEQLRLKSEDDFWLGLDGKPSTYNVPPVTPPLDPLPDYLLRFLSEVRHLSNDDIGQLSREAAQGMLDAHYSQRLLE